MSISSETIKAINDFREFNDENDYQNVMNELYFGCSLSPAFAQMSENQKIDLHDNFQEIKRLISRVYESTE